MAIGSKTDTSHTNTFLTLDFLHLFSHRGLSGIVSLVSDPTDRGAVRGYFAVRSNRD